MKPGRNLTSSDSNICKLSGVVLKYAEEIEYICENILLL